MFESFASPKYYFRTMLQIRIRTYLFLVLCLIAVVQFFATPGTYNYSHLPVEAIHTQLYKQITRKLSLQKTKPYCDYDDILKSEVSIHPWEISEKVKYFNEIAVDNGSYIPRHCNPMFSVAIIVIYRNRPNQLDVFLPYMHDFLKKQNIHYKIYLVEQQDEKPFNRGMLLNIGAKQAILDHFPCLILHDVDLLPLDASNLYACTNNPRHMSASIDKFRYVLTYSKIVGGVLAIRTDQYVAVNGFSNRFNGWGGEDDDFANRLSSNELTIVRFPREMSRYTMLRHSQEPKNSRRVSILSENLEHLGTEGLNTLPAQNSKLEYHRFYTLIGVKL